MRTPVITSVKSRPRSPLAAFTLSFFFTGLGEMYNGHLSRGLAFLAARLVLLLCVPAFAVLHPRDSALRPVALLCAAALLLSLGSPLYAMVLSLRQRNAGMKIYNRVPAYIAQAVLGVAFTSAALAVLSSCFSIIPARGTGLAPLGLPGEFLLVNRCVGAGPGDLALSAGRSPARLLAREGDAVAVEGGVIFVGGQRLERGVVRPADIRRLPADLAEHALSERTGEARYAVLVPAADRSPAVSLTVKKGQVLLVSDNRLQKNYYFTVPTDSLRGRIEGVLFSRVPSRCLRKSLLD